MYGIVCPGPNLLFRQYRVERINQGLQPNLKLRLTLISAPADIVETKLPISKIE